MIGRTIAHYQILDRVGEGGMGVVYKARDTHLERFVAIKVLPPERVADPDRKRRFIQEARAASSLNHPNIITLHDIVCDAGVDFMVMEFVAGKTLDQLIGRKGLKLNDGLKYGAQIAAALAAAHAAGIIHRDLKPGNVMVTEGDLVKVLDFGLAKLAEPGTADLATTETLKPRTEEGAIVGTVAYMSPEQAQGKKVDARSDIFSFGLVLYEMITGQRAFQGETKLSTLSAIVDKEPTPVSAIAPETPPELEKLIARCLRKDPDRRAQNMTDLKLALEELKEESDSGKLRAPARPRPRISVPVVTALLLVVLAAAGVAWWLARSRSTAPAPTLALTRLTSDSGLTTDPALSADGKLLAYASDRSGEGHLDIYVRQVGGGEPLRLTRGPGDKHEPSFSPDGTRIAFRSEQEGGGIYVVSALGGPPRRIVPEGHQPQFSPDGNWMAYSLQLGSCFGTRNTCKIYVVPSGGGEPRQVRPDFAAAFYAVWSPDGNHLLFLGKPDEKLPREEGFDWWVTPLDSGPAIKTGALEATRNANLSGPVQVYRWMLLAPAWQPQGDALVFSAQSGDSTNLWRIGISPKTWKVTGPPQRLTSGAAEEEAPSAASGPGGIVRLAFASLTDNLDIWSLPIEPNQGKVTGEPKRLTQEAGPDFHPGLSPDGNKMTWVSARSGSQQVWIRDLRTGEDSALTASRSDKWRPRFSPDGSRVSFSSYENNKWNVYVMPASGGTPERICEDCGEAEAWSSDGKRIIGDRVEPQAWVLDLATRHKTDLLAIRPWVFSSGDLSPDNRWCILVNAATGRTSIAPFGEVPAAESTWMPLVDGWDWEWSPDGKLIYTVSGRDGFSCIWEQRLDAVTKRPVGALFPVFHAHNARISLANQPEVYLSIGRDKILFNMAERTGNIWMAEFKP
jgi:eukaryotic-like serine/threonine-protein kinase